MDGWPSDSNNATGLTTTGRFGIHVSLIALHTFCSAGGVRRIGNDQIVEVGEIPSSVNRPRQSPIFQVFHFHGATWELNHGTETLQGFGYLTMDKSASQVPNRQKSLQTCPNTGINIIKHPCLLAYLASYGSVFKKWSWLSPRRANSLGIMRLSV